MSKRKGSKDRTGHETKAGILNAVFLKKDYQSVKAYLVHVIALKSELSSHEFLDDTHFSFDEIGIDSLKMVEIINTINRDLGLDLQAAEVFKNNTLDSLISLVEQNSGAAGNRIYNVS